MSGVQPPPSFELGFAWLPSSRSSAVVSPFSAASSSWLASCAASIALIAAPGSRISSSRKVGFRISSSSSAITSLWSVRAHLS
eukprot:2299296-Prymnesium_polylepis.2